MKIKIGDIILVPFPYTDLTGSKLRPALVLFISKLDVTVIFMTTNLEVADGYDVLLRPDTFNDLAKPTLIKISKLVTIDKELSKRNYGYISDRDRRKVMDNLTALIKSGY